MGIEQTLSLIKPDGVARGLIGEVIGRLEKRGLNIRALKMVQLSKTQALNFYQVHKERPFYQSLTTFMSSGPIVALILEGDHAVQVYRELMGATDYRQAAPAPSGPTLPGRSRPISSTAPTARRARPAKSSSSSTPWSWFSIVFREYWEFLFYKKKAGPRSSPPVFTFLTYYASGISRRFSSSVSYTTSLPTSRTCPCTT